MLPGGRVGGATTTIPPSCNIPNSLPPFHYSYRVEQSAISCRTRSLMRRTTPTVKAGMFFLVGLYIRMNIIVVLAREPRDNSFPGYRQNGLLVCGTLVDFQGPMHLKNRSVAVEISAVLLVSRREKLRTTLFPIKYPLTSVVPKSAPLQ